MFDPIFYISENFSKERISIPFNMYRPFLSQFIKAKFMIYTCKTKLNYFSFNFFFVHMFISSNTSVIWPFIGPIFIKPLPRKMLNFSKP